jgi:hypothetical protein
LGVSKSKTTKGNRMKKSEQKEFFHSPKNTDEWKKIKDKYDLRPASISHTMGPNYKHIHWLVINKNNRKPFAQYKENENEKRKERYN